MKVSIFLAVCALSIGAVASSQATAPSTSTVPEKIPSAIFAKQPLLRAPILSPNGEKLLARTVSSDGREMLMIFTLSSGSYDTIPAPEKGEIAWYRWAGTDRVLISIATTVPYLNDEARMTRLVAYDVVSQTAKFLGRRNQGLEGDDILYVDPDGAYLLMQIQRTIYEWPSVFRVDIGTAAMTEIVRAQQPIWEWYADGAGTVRAGVGMSDRRWTMVYRANANEKFRKVGTARIDDDEATLDLLRINRNSDEGHVLSNKKTGRFALYKYNFATRELGELVYENLEYDLTDFDLTADGTAIEAIRYTDERDRVVWFNPELKRHQAEIEKALNGRLSRLINRTRDGKKMLFWIGASNNPGHYYYYDTAVGVMQPINAVNKDLPGRLLSPSRYVHYRARDGLKISAYLTLPRGRPEKGLPLIILPHGGPYDVRDKLSYDAEVQFLANRGYAVFQPNFRGSGGYGRDFYKKGEGQMGRTMQDDLDDGMDWLAKEGLIDPKRVCLVGASYGGYAALWGATRNPERYRCAASFAGVSDMGRQLKYSLTYAISKRYQKNWRNTVRGEGTFDLDTISPLHQVDRLRVPVLVVHGKEDRTVPFKQSSLYAAALEKAGKTHEFHVYNNEGHGFDNAADLKDWFDRLEAFLTKYNPA